jgi:hypothetical protein
LSSLVLPNLPSSCRENNYPAGLALFYGPGPESYLLRGFEAQANSTHLFLTWRFAEAECSTSVTVLNLFPFAAQRQEQEVLWGTPFLSFSFYLMDTLITHLLSSIGTVRPCGLSVKTRN